MKECQKCGNLWIVDASSHVCRELSNGAIDLVAHALEIRARVLAYEVLEAEQKEDAVALLFQELQAWNQKLQTEKTMYSIIADELDTLLRKITELEQSNWKGNPSLSVMYELFELAGIEHREF